MTAFPIVLDTLVFSWNDIFEIPDTLGNSLIVTKLDGWHGAPARRTKHTDRIGADGVFRAPAYREARSIDMEGRYFSPDRFNFRRLERRLAAVCPDPGQLYPMTVQDEVGPLTAYVELAGDIQIALASPRYGEFSYGLLAPDPRKFNIDWTSSTAPFIVEGSDGIETTGLGIITADPGIATGTSPTPAIAVAYGQGTSINPQVLQVNGPASNFSITNTSGSTTFGFRGTVGSAETLYINLDSLPAYGVPGASGAIPGHGAIIGRNNARADLSVRGGWPVLAPGAVATYLISGSLGFGSAFIVHSRGAWS